MAIESAVGLSLHLTPSEGEPDAQLLDDLIRLVKQAIATTPSATTSIPALQTANDVERRELRGLESKIKHRIEQASAASRVLVEQRAALAQQPDAEAQLAEDSRAKAQRVVAAVRNALMKGIVVKIPDTAP